MHVVFAPVTKSTWRVEVFRVGARGPLSKGVEVSDGWQTTTNPPKHFMVEVKVIVPIEGKFPTP